MKYVVYTEIINSEFSDNKVERWYYGTYDHDRANEVAHELGQDYENQVFHSVCPLDEAEAWEIKNLPR